MVEIEHLGGDVEVSVVVDDGDPVLTGQCRGEQVGDADRSVPTAAGQLPLCGEGALPVLVVGGQVLIGRASIGPELLILARVARAVEGLGIQRRRRWLPRRR
jgi:hypothetical protein